MRDLEGGDSGENGVINGDLESVHPRHGQPDKPWMLLLQQLKGGEGGRPLDGERGRSGSRLVS